MTDRQARRAAKAEARKDQKRPKKVDWLIVALCIFAIVAVAFVGGKRPFVSQNEPPPGESYPRSQ